MLTIRRTATRDSACFESFSDGLVYQTPGWMSFLQATQGGEPVWAEVQEDGRTVGLFTGMKVRKMGIPVLGSPFPGWTTMYMGFNLAPEVSRLEALQALEHFAFRDLGCLHLEIADRWIDPESASSGGWAWRPITTFVNDLRPSEDEIFGQLKRTCRQYVRQAEKRGVTVEEVQDPDGFVEEYYDQLKGVFARQNLVPTYPMHRVHALIEALSGTPHLLLLRARDPDGRCIATAIYVGMNDVAQVWGGASRHEDHQWRPNEAIHWYALRHWKAAGASFFDWGGGGEHKLKYGSFPIEIPWIGKSRFRTLHALRNGAEQVHAQFRRLRGRLHTFGNGA